MKSSYVKAIVPIVLGLILLVLPAPAGLKPEAWRFFALFAAVVVGLILEPLPAAAVGFIGVTIAAAFGMVDPSSTNSINWALAGFANSTVWLIFAAFMFALGYQKTGLGKRLGLILVKLLGKSTLGLGYAVAFADLILAPFMPSNTARSGGTLFPILRNIPALYGSEPGPTSRKIGSFIMWVALAATCVTSSMFITALAPNLLAIDAVTKGVKYTITWPEWAIGFLPAGIILMLVLPLLVYVLHPPEIKKSTEVPAWAAGELSKMGAITRNELIMAGLAVLALVMWIFIDSKIINATTVALIVIGMMLILNVVHWDDVLSNKAAWNVLVWFATLVTLADGLSKVGFTAWIGTTAAGLFAGANPVVVMVLLVVIFFVTHYIFASVTAHVTAMLPVFLAAGAAVPGMNVPVLALMLCYSLGIMGIITPYATGPSPVYYGSGFVSKKDFWLLGLIFGAIFLVVFLVVETPYLLMLHP
ncbi:MAG: anion permease [Thermoflexales bacterium]|nr:anion permease [Thermoflexales bacterium]